MLNIKSLSIRLVASLGVMGVSISNGIAAVPQASQATRTEAASTQAQATTLPNTTQVKGATLATQAPKPRPRSSFYLGLGPSLVNVHGFTGLMPKLSLGYGALLNCDRSYYLGAEVFSGLWTIPLTNNQYHRTTNVYGASVITGYNTVDYTLYFIRLGVENAQFTNYGSSNVGGLVGVGFQVATSRNWDARVEYDYGTNQNINLYSLDVIYHFFR